MSETPQQIDLSQDLESQGITLSESQQTRYQEYLNTLEEAERNEIIYLTRQELEEFQNTLDLETSIIDNPRGATDSAFSSGETLATFMGEQIREWLSTADLVESAEWNLFTPELLNEFDSISQEILFGDEWLFNGLSLDSSVQDLTSVSMSFAFLEHLQTNPQLLQTIITSLNAEGANERDIIMSMLTSMNESFGDISTTIVGFEWVWGDILVAGNGLNNGIFREVDTWKDFFTGILNGEITSTNVIAKIQEQNTENVIENAIADVDGMRELINAWSLTTEELISIIANIETGGTDTPPPGWNNDTPPVTSPETESYLDSLRNSRPLGALFAAILQFLQGLWLANIDASWNIVPRTAAEPETWPEATEIAPQTITRVRDFFSQNANSGIFEWMNRESILALFPESGELPETAQHIIRTLEDTPGGWTVEEKMQNLFINEVALSDTDASQGNVPKLTRFLHDMHSVTWTEISIQSDWVLSPSDLLTAVNAYKSYRVENESWKAEAENAALNRDMTYVEYFNRNQSDTAE